MPAGSIVIDLLMRTGSFDTDTERGRKNLQKLKAEAEDLGKKFALGVVGATTALAYLVKSTIDTNDHLNDLSKKTGIAVDTLGGIGFAAGQAGGDLDSAAAAAGKLNKSLVEAAGGNKELASTFKALGVDVKDANGNVKTADVALVELADKFASFEEGPEKAALAVKLFGKSGADLLPLLDDGGKALQENIEYYKRYSGVTQDAADKADQFNDTVGKLKLLSGAFGQALTAEVLPALQNLADLWLKNKEEGDGFASTAGRLADVFKGVIVGVAYLGTTFAITGEQIGAFAAKIGALARGDFDQVAEIGKEASANLVKARKEFAEFYDAIYNGRKKADSAPFHAADNYGGDAPAKKRAPVIADSGATDAAAAELKKRLDAQLKLIEDFGKAQGQAYQFANSYLAAAYNDAELSQKDFFQQQQNVRDAALRAELDAIDKQIAAQRAFISNPASKPEDRVAAEDKIKLAVQQRAEVVTKASQTDILANQQNAQAVLQLKDAYDDLRAQILQATGDDAGAAAIKNAQAVKRARDLIAQAGGDPGLADQQAKILDNQTRAAQIQKDYNKLLDDTARKEQEIYLDAAAGGKGELETLAAIRDARKEAIAVLQQQAAAAADLAAISGTDEDKKRAADLAVAVKKAASEIDPIAKQINGSLTDALSSPLSEFFKGTKSASDAFKDFTANVLSDIAELAAKDLATSLFGGNSGQGGIGAAISSLFGGGGGGASSGGSGDWASSLASAFGGFFAGGGDPPLNKVSVIGEKGPELFVPKTAGTVLPNSTLKGGSTNQRTQVNNISIALPQGADRRTGMQIGTEVGRQIEIASSRNG
jgi:hypothetical protein